jgi:hypothetical protein
MKKLTAILAATVLFAGVSLAQDKAAPAKTDKKAAKSDKKADKKADKKMDKKADKK